MYYRHNLDFEYPQRCDEHMLKVNRKREIKFDENYPYFRRDFGFKCLRAGYWLIQNCIIFWLLRLTHGLRIFGKKNLKKHKKALKNGAITISNHVFMWDYLCVLKAIRPHLSYFPAWKENMAGGFAGMIRMSGGVPIPTDSVRAMVQFNRAMEQIFESGKWVHFYPEGSLWFYYPDVRPFKNAVFKYATKYDKPLIPLAFSFRPRRGIQKLFGKKPLVDLHIGEPLFPDKNLHPADASAKMQAEAYDVIQRMCGIMPTDPNYNADQNPDRYVKTM